jgi:GNAT superfamily N-acetyltransferase
LYLVDMAVHPGHQRLGVGKLLVETAKLKAREWQGQSLRLDSYTGPAGAVFFYLKCGFAQRGEVVYKNVPHAYFEWLNPGKGESKV